jgi:hypothetical protein
MGEGYLAQEALALRLLISLFKDPPSGNFGIRF